MLEKTQPVAQAAGDLDWVKPATFPGEMAGLPAARLTHRGPGLHRTERCIPGPRSTAAARETSALGGLALLPLLVALAFVAARRTGDDYGPARPWQPHPLSIGAATVCAALVISGFTGALLALVALAVRYLLRRRARIRDAATVGTAAFGLILAGAVLSQYPWRSVDGYLGHSAGVQLLALLSVLAVAMSTVTFAEPRRAPRGDDKDG